MKKFICLSVLTMMTLNSSFAVPVKLNIRSAKNEMKTITIDSLEISGSNLAETEDFRVMKSVDNNVIDFTSTENTENELLRSATALYHAKIARNYFVNIMNAPKAITQPQITVRIDMNHPFNEFYHFIPESKLLEYNNAVTIPASNSKAMPSVEKWNNEIWFRSAKEEEIDNSVYQVAKVMDQMDLTTEMLKTVTDQNVQNSVVSSTLEESFSSVDYMGFVESILYTVGVFKIAPKFLMFATGKIKTKTFLDTAMIPEVVYHEYTHYAISDFVSLRRSTPMNEGMANYFAAVISNSSNIAEKNGKFSKNMGGYEGNSKMMYQSTMETSNSAHSNFVFSYLWRLRLRMTKEFKDGDKLTDKLIFNARQYVTFAKKPIKDDLLPALTKSVDDIIPKNQARKARMIITEVATQKGL
jgi:hypothetical protein